MNKGKAIWIKLFVLCFVFVVGVCKGDVVKAANDDFTGAKSINVNVKVQNILLYNDGSHYYKFTLNETGYININFEHQELEAEGRCWYVSLYDAERTLIEDMYSHGNEKSVRMGNIGLPQGTYYVVVSAYSSPASKINYEMTVDYVNTNSWEKEFNGGYTIANDISVNNKYYGTSKDVNDTDYYKFSLAEAGYINVDFEHQELEAEGRCWYISLYDVERTLIEDMYSHGNEKSVRMGNIGLPQGTYYVVVSAYSSPASKINYEMTVDYVNTNSWEKEFNGGYTIANDISVNNEYYGTSKDVNDTDYYKFSLAETGYLNISFQHGKIESDSRCWSIGVYDLNRNYITGVYGYGNITMTNLSTKVLNKGSYYLVIAAYSSNAAKVDYNFKVYNGLVVKTKFPTFFNEPIRMVW